MRNSERSRQRGALLIAAGLSGALLLSGCSASYWPDLSGDTVEETQSPVPESGSLATVPVNEAQIQRIIDAVAEAAAAGDSELDAAAIEERFTGDALTQRTSNYKIRSAVSDYASKPAAITGDLLQYQLVQSTEGWPRNLFLTVASEAQEAQDGDAAEAPSLAIMLKQRIPQENFQVTRVISLRGGIEMPQAAPAEEGTAVLAPDLGTLVMQPGAVGEAYAAILQNGEDTDEAELFELTDDPLIGHYGKAWVTQSQEKSASEDKTQSYSVSITQGDEQVLSLSTGVGGALVATTILESQVVDSDGSRYKPQAEGAVAALSGLSGQQDKIVRTVAHQLLFFVPSKEDGSKIELLGVTSELIGAGN